MKSLNSGISGLRAFQTKMDVIGNNIANVDTVGFKSSRVTFADMLSQTVNSSGQNENSAQSNVQVGLGVRIASIDRDFNQGGFQSTGRTTDLAIEGNGFFMVNENGRDLLTRAGNFSFNKEGFLVDQSGRNVQGFNANAAGGITSNGAAEDIRVDFENIFEPQATQNIFVAGNLNTDTSQSRIIQAQNALTTDNGTVANGGTLLNNLSQTSTDFAAGDTIAFDVTLNDGTAQTVTHNFNDGDTLDDLINTINTNLPAGEGTVSLVDGLMVMRSAQLGDSQLAISGVNTTGTGAINFPGFETTQEGKTNSQTMSSTVFDELGRSHTLSLKLTQTNVNTWQYDTSFLDGEQIQNGNSGTLTFDESGNLTSENTLAIDFDPGNGANPMSFTVNLGNPEDGSKLSQFSGSNSAKVVSQDGFAQGNLVDVRFDGDGFINGIFDNGQNLKLGQMAVADVANYNGLEARGGNSFSASANTGDITVNTASNLANTNLNSGILEGSNVDIAEQFTEMITSQRAFQSNARVITTADEFLQEAVNLVR